MRSGSGPAAPPAPPRPIGSLASADEELKNIRKRRQEATQAVRSEALGVINKATTSRVTHGLQDAGAGPVTTPRGKTNLLSDPEAMSTDRLAALADTGPGGLKKAQLGSDPTAGVQGPGGFGASLGARLFRAANFEKDRAGQLEDFINKELSQLDKARVSKGRGRSENIVTRLNRRGITGSLIGNASRTLI